MNFTRRVIAYLLPLGLVLFDGVLRIVYRIDTTGVVASGLGAVGLGLLSANLMPGSSTISQSVRRVAERTGRKVVAIIDSTDDKLFGITLVFLFLGLVFWMAAIGIDINGKSWNVAGLKVGGWALASVNVAAGIIITEVRLHYDQRGA